MSKQKEHMRGKKQQKNQSRLFMIAGIALVLTAGLWLALRNRQPDSLRVQPISRLSTSDFHSLAFSITAAETVYFGHHHGLLVSRNGGRDWESTSLPSADAMALALPTSDPQIMYAA